MATRVLTVKQAAARLGITKQSVSQFIHAGLLPAQNVSENRFAPRWRITARDVRRFEQSRTFCPTDLTPRQVAEQLGISAHRVVNWLARQDIPGHFHGARWAIKQRDLKYVVARLRRAQDA